MRDRRELIRQLDILLVTLFVYIWFLDKNLLLLALKIGLQVQYCNPASFNPDLPLPILCRTVLFFNLAPIVTHALFWTGTGKSPLDDVDGTGIGGTYSRSGRTGFVLDFIGQAYQPSKIHLLLLDLLTTFLQWLFIIIVSETEKAEELRPDLDQYGLLDGDPEHEILLLSPNEPRPHTHQVRLKSRSTSTDRSRGREQAPVDAPQDSHDSADDDLSDAGSDAPLRPHRLSGSDNGHGIGVGVGTGAEPGARRYTDRAMGDQPAMPPRFEQSELRTRKRKGRRRPQHADLAGNADPDVVESASGSGVEDSTGQGWSPRDEEASLFLPTIASGAEQIRQQRRSRSRGRALLSERTSLTHPIAHIPLGQLLRNTFTFTAMPEPGTGSGSGSGPGSHATPSSRGPAAVDNRRAPSIDNPARTEVTATPGSGGALPQRPGRMVGSRLGIVPLFRRYNEGEEANTGPGGNAAVAGSGSVRAGAAGQRSIAGGTIPVIALPFTAPTIRITSGEVTPPTSEAAPSTRAPPRSGGDGSGTAAARGSPPGTPEESSWAWVMRNFNVPRPQLRSGQQPQESQR